MNNEVVDVFEQLQVAYKQIDELILKAQTERDVLGNSSPYLAGYISGLGDAYNLVYNLREKLYGND